MFKFLKDKLKSAVSSLTQKISTEGKEETIEQVVPAEEKPKETQKPAKQTAKQPEAAKPKHEEKEKEPEKEPEKKGFFSRLKDQIFKKEDITEVPEEELEEVSIIEKETEKKAKSEKKQPEKPAPKHEARKVEAKEEKEKEAFEKKQAEAKIKDKLKKREVPSVEELAARKPELKHKPKHEEPKKAEEEIKSDAESKFLTEEEKLELEEIEPDKAIPKPAESFEEDTTEETEEEEIEEEDEEAELKQEIIEIEKEEAIKEEKLEEKKAEKREEIQEEKKEEKKGFFARIKEAITTKKITEEQFEEMFWDLEVGLLENNVAVEVIEKIKHDLKIALVDTPIPRNKIEEAIISSLKSTIQELFDVEQVDFLKAVKRKKPFVICFFGINGSGKTTTIAKIAYMLKKNNISCVLAAADTFRAAAIDQLTHHADAIGVPIIKQNYGSDPAAVAFDAIKSAQAKNIDVVLIDTAGRMHSNSNLMDEMKKIMRVAKPDLKIFIGESITGNDCTEQAKKFDEAVGLDGIILSKADIDEKGGAAISVSYVTKKPILFIGTGQEYDDIKKFDSKLIISSLGL